MENNKINIALFANDKQGNENRPDYKGTISLNVSAWKRVSKNGKEYLSLSLEPFTPKREESAPSDGVARSPFGDPLDLMQ